jgi:hypothetical protein
MAKVSIGMPNSIASAMNKSNGEANGYRLTALSPVKASVSPTSGD